MLYDLNIKFGYFWDTLCIVIFDEKWILYDNLKRSASWLDKDKSPKHSTKPNIHQMKLMVTACWIDFKEEKKYHLRFQRLNVGNDGDFFERYDYNIP